MKQVNIQHNPGYDFHIIQNYVIQMVAQGIINKNSFLLYAFYQSLSGFQKIYCSYDYISKNTGLSKGAISGSNKQLKDNGLIKIIKNGYNKPNQIIVRSGNELPRRELKKVHESDTVEYECEEIEFNPVTESSVDEQQGSTDEQEVQHTNSTVRQDEPINIKNIDTININNTTTGKKEFIEEFKFYWCKMNKTDKYRIRDEDAVDEIDNYSLAKKLIPILWQMDSIDPWVNKSNHSLKVFVKEYKNGNLQSLYPKTGQFYKDKNREELINA